MSLKSISKAIAAAVGGFGGAFATAAMDDNVTGNEWVGIVCAALIAGATVYFAPANEPVQRKTETEPMP